MPGVATAGLQRVTGVLPPFAGEREINVFARADAEWIALEESRPLLAHPLRAGQAHARFVAQREGAPPTRGELGGDGVEVAERARVVPQNHRRRGHAGLAVDEDGAAALRGEADATHVPPTAADLTAQRAGGGAQRADDRCGVLLALAGFVHVEREALFRLREQPAASRVECGSLQRGRADVYAEIHISRDQCSRRSRCAAIPAPRSESCGADASPAV